MGQLKRGWGGSRGGGVAHEGVGRLKRGWVGSRNEDGSRGGVEDSYSKGGWGGSKGNRRHKRGWEGSVPPNSILCPFSYLQSLHRVTITSLLHSLKDKNKIYYMY